MRRPVSAKIMINQEDKIMLKVNDLKNLKKLGVFAGGVLFGTAGIAVLASKDAKKLYTQCTAAVLRGKDSVMKTTATLKENCGDIYADAKDIIHIADSVCRIVPDLVVEVDDRVGIAAVGLVYHVLDIDIFLRYQIKDAVYHAGHVVVDDAKAADAHTLELCRRQVHGICDVAVFEILVKLLCRHLGAAVLALGRACAQMRQGYDVSAAEYLLVGEIGDVFCDLARFESCEHRVVVNDLGAGFINDPHAVAHGGKGLCIEHMVGILVIGDIDSYIVAIAEYLVYIVGSDNLA